MFGLFFLNMGIFLLSLSRCDDDMLLHSNVQLGWRKQYIGIEMLEHDGVTFYFVDNEFYYKRPGIYGYGDEAERFGFFCRGVIEALPYIDFQPDVIHCHDWQAGMIPVLLKAHYQHLPFFREIKTMMTVHNLKYQGVFGLEVFKDLFGLSDDHFTGTALELHGGASYLKGGLLYSDQITTVSQTYAEEIQTSYYGEFLDSLLRHRKDQLTGIVNGIDYDDVRSDDGSASGGELSRFVAEEDTRISWRYKSV